MQKKTFWTKRTMIVTSSVVALIGIVALTLVLVIPGMAHAQSIPFVSKLTPRYANASNFSKLALNSKYASELVNEPTRFNSIPFWGSSFSYAGHTYPYTMVGANPAYGRTSKIQTEIIPVKVTFNNVTFDGIKRVGAVSNSPLFLNSNYAQGRSQYGDTIMRSNFWQYASHNNYHVLLTYPALESSLVLNVPASRGALFNTSGGEIVVIDINWWYNVILNNLYGRHTSPNVFPIFVTNNVLLSQGSPTNPGNCCIIGYHDAQFQPGSTINVDTYAWGSYVSDGVFGSTPIEDVNALSHEVAEWLNDPFTSNIVPYWSVASQPQYGCNNLLEVGDPLVGTAFVVRTTYGSFHMQDEAFFAWFAHQVPSVAYHGLYSYEGNFTSPAVVCTP